MIKVALGSNDRCFGNYKSHMLGAANINTTISDSGREGEEGRRGGVYPKYELTKLHNLRLLTSVALFRLPLQLQTFHLCHYL